MTKSVDRARLRLDAWEGYAHGTRGEHFEWWSARNLTLGQSRFAGTPFELERSWQAPIMYEALAVDVEGDPYWQTVAIILPRKNGKTATLGGYATYSLDQGEGEPEILLAAGSNDQADKLYSAAAGFIRRSPGLSVRMVLRQHVGQIARSDGAGTLKRLSSEGETQHGANPSLVVIDELAWWRAPRHRRLWGALTTADGARSETQVFAITTEGEASGRSESILGGMVEDNERGGDVERLHGCTISRDHDARLIVFRFHAVDARAADPRPLRDVRDRVKREPSKALEREKQRLEEALVASVLPANPASWITAKYLVRKALNSAVRPSDFLQLHANVAADMQERWITAEQWASLRGECDLEDGDTIAAAIDAALSHDSTALTWGHKTAGDKVCIHCHTWCARRDVAAHEHVEGGRIRNEPVKAMLRSLADRYHLDSVMYDPRYFADAAMELSDEGLVMIEMAQQSRAMRDAETQFKVAIDNDKIQHTGDRVLAAHVASTVAEPAEGGVRIRKLKQTAVIDATVSAIMLYARAMLLAHRYSGPLVEVFG